MLRSLALDIQSIATTRSMDELRDEVSRSVKRLGFDSFSLSLNKSTPLEFVTSPTLTDLASEEFNGYLADYWSQDDPIFIGTTTAKAPFLWHWQDWRDGLARGFAEYLSLAGLCGGATIPLPQDDGRLSGMTMLSYDDAALTPDALHSAQILANMSMLRATNLQTPSAPSEDIKRRLALLSNRQIEILSWISRGKTNREIAMIIDSNRRTIDYHVQEILNKLEVSSRTQAATFFIASET